MTVASQLMTAEQLLRKASGRRRYELINGVLQTMAPAGSSHGYVANLLGSLLTAFVQARRLGAVFAAETGYLLTRDPDTVRAPDVSFVQKKRIPKDGLPEAFWPGAPDLAVEVLSPTDTASKTSDKIKQWLDAGTQPVWLIDPRLKTVTVYRSLTSVTVLTIKDTLDGEKVIPGFECKVSDLFWT